jgi:proteasome accessory factor A
MSVHRVMGIETEYGVSVPGHPHVNAMASSSQVVNAYAHGVLGDRRAAMRWDYDEETPLRDARGFDLTRADADPGLLTDDDLGLANLVLTNGARLYVDHAHPEYSSPEVTNPRDGVLWDRAGERVMARAAVLVPQLPGGRPVRLYKNNTDNKGVSYGTHENYLMARATPFAEVVRHLIPFFVTRQVITGAGRVGLGQDGKAHGFQLSQRADFFEVEVGLETTLKRPIINTRDEPHADPEKYRRLHVIVGDANLAELSTYLKLGTTSLMLAMIEADYLQLDLVLARPVQEMHSVSHDHTLAHRVTTAAGRELTAVQVQIELCEQARKFVEDRLGADVDAMTADVLDRWEAVLDQLLVDPAGLAGELDWPTKLSVLQGYRDRDGLGWEDPRLHLVDLQYSDVDPARGLAQRLQRNGRLARLTTEAEVERAVTDPPHDTRAYFRGECVRRYGDDVAAASWDSVIFDIPGQDTLQRVATMEPLRGTRAAVADLLDRSPTAADLLAALGS